MKRGFEPRLLARGNGGNRTLDLLLARQALYQLSYAPIKGGCIQSRRRESNPHARFRRPLLLSIELRLVGGWCRARTCLRGASLRCYAISANQPLRREGSNLQPSP